ncbi:sialidase/neuraminidase family protein [Chitinophaga lutea]|nr:glycoside hydrolase [Chitinophaga lutea]
MRYYLLLIITALAACNNAPSGNAHETVLSDTTRNASCVYLTNTEKGNPVISWVEDGGMYYAVSPDGGKTFAAPKRITTASGIQPHPENMPKIIFRPNGEVIAMYGLESNDPRNKYAGKVCYVRSMDGGASWLPAQPLVTDTAGYDQRYFDMALLPSGEVAAIWLDNRKFHRQEGSTLYMATAGAAGFEKERPLVQTVCQCCRTALYTDGQGALHAAFRDIINDSIRDMVHIVSTDGGRSFTTPVRISADNWMINGCPHTGPAMVKNSSGLHFAWFTMGGGEGVFYCQSPDNGITYSKRENISALPTAKHPQLTALGNGDLALVWDEAVDTAANRIGLLHKSPAGETLSKRFLTEAGGYANFPVLRAAGNGQVLVAYKKRIGERDVVCAQLVGL